MDLETLRRQRPGRGLCLRCLHPPLTCYCAKLRPFYPGIRFVILIHGREAQKRIATGRLAYLCLENAELLPGYDYSAHARVNALIQDSGKHCVVLYPGPGSRNLSDDLERGGTLEIGPAHKELVVFVIDGTWITARKTMQRSQNLRELSRVCFTPPAASRFRVRKQPGEECFSTVEAIHQAVELLGPGRGFSLAERRHDVLLEAFDHMVEQQIELSSRPKLYCQWRPPSRSLKPRPPSN